MRWHICSEAQKENLPKGMHLAHFWGGTASPQMGNALDALLGLPLLLLGNASFSPASLEETRTSESGTPSPK